MEVINYKLKSFLPNLYDHFKECNFSIDMVFTANILTIFLSNEDGHQINTILLDILEIFIVESWPGLIRIVLFILKVTLILDSSKSIIENEF